MFALKVGEALEVIPMSLFRRNKLKLFWRRVFGLRQVRGGSRGGYIVVENKELIKYVSDEAKV